MLWLVSGNLKEGRVKEYIAWLNKNEKLLKEHAPKGMNYHGTYMYVLGFGRFDVMTAWEMKDYGDFELRIEYKTVARADSDRPPKRR